MERHDAQIRSLLGLDEISTRNEACRITYRAVINILCGYRERCSFSPSCPGGRVSTVPTSSKSKSFRGSTEIRSGAATINLLGNPESFRQHPSPRERKATGTGIA